MTGRERIASVVAGRMPDRPAASFWRHHPREEITAAGLVRATVEFQRRFGWDLVKINPRAEYHTEAWGNRYAFYDDPHRRPTLLRPRIRSPHDWRTLEHIEPTDGVLGEHLRAVRTICDQLAGETPVVMTVFSPLSVAAELAGLRETEPGRVFEHGDELETGLGAITGTFRSYVRELLAAGCDGIFFATTRLGSRTNVRDEDFRRFSRPHDLDVLGAASGAGCNMLHVCGARAMLDLTPDYPAQILSWDMADPTNPGAVDVAARWGHAMIGGVAQSLTSDPARGGAAVEQARAALDAVGSHRLIVGAGCVVPTDVDPAVLDRLRRLAAEWAGPAHG